MNQRNVEPRWHQLSAEVMTGISDWRFQHPKATLREIETELDARLAHLRAHARRPGTGERCQRLDRAARSRAACLSTVWQPACAARPPLPHPPNPWRPKPDLGTPLRGLSGL